MLGGIVAGDHQLQGPVRIFHEGVVRIVDGDAFHQGCIDLTSKKGAAIEALVEPRRIRRIQFDPVGVRPLRHRSPRNRSQFAGRHADKRIGKIDCSRIAYAKRPLPSGVLKAQHIMLVVDAEVIVERAGRDVAGDLPGVDEVLGASSREGGEDYVAHGCCLVAVIGARRAAIGVSIEFQ